jgi:hypothetical protein
MCQDLGCLLEIQGYREKEREGMCEDLGWVEIHREKERDTHTVCARVCAHVCEYLGWVEIHRERERERERERWV